MEPEISEMYLQLNNNNNNNNNNRRITQMKIKQQDYASQQISKQMNQTTQ